MERFDASVNKIYDNSNFGVERIVTEVTARLNFSKPHFLRYKFSNFVS